MYFLSVGIYGLEHFLIEQPAPADHIAAYVRTANNTPRDTASDAPELATRVESLPKGELVQSHG